MLNLIKYELSRGDISKLNAVESLPVEVVYEYYYLTRIGKLNENLMQAAMMRK